MSLISRNLRRTALAAAAAGILLSAAACGGSSDSSSSGSGNGGSTSGGSSGGSSSSPVTMTLWTNASTGDGTKFFQDAADAYHSAHPDVTIKVTNIQNENIDGKLETALQAGKGSAPDIFFQRGGGKLQAMVEAGQVKDISDQISSDIKSNISDGTFAVDQVDGKTYGVPLTVTPEGFWYSKDLFKKAGITGTPKTLDDLNADVAKLKAAGIVPIGLGGKDAWPAAHYYYMFAIRDCTKDALDKAASTLQFNDDCFKKAGEDTQTFAGTQPFEPDFQNVPAQQGAGSSAGQLANHKVAMELMGAWEPGQVGDLTPNKKPLPDLGFFPFPSVDGGAGDQSAIMAGADAYSCSQWAPDECADFLNFLAAADEDSKYATAFGSPPANKQAQASLTDPTLKSAVDASNSAPYVVLFLDTLYGGNVGNALNTSVVNLLTGSGDVDGIISAVNGAGAKG